MEVFPAYITASYSNDWQQKGPLVSKNPQGVGVLPGFLFFFDYHCYIHVCMGMCVCLSKYKYDLQSPLVGGVYRVS